MTPTFCLVAVALARQHGASTPGELAEALGEVARNKLALPVEQTHGRREARGTTIAGTQVHSVRLPGIVLAIIVWLALSGFQVGPFNEAGVARWILGAPPTPGSVSK